MTDSEAITLDLDGRSIEIATGYQGVGVFLTIIGARGNRIITVPLPRSKADELARLLRLASAASRFHDALHDAHPHKPDDDGETPVRMIPELSQGGNP